MGLRANFLHSAVRSCDSCEL